MAFSRPSPTTESRRDSPSLSLVRLPLPFTLHKVAIYSHLSRPHSSFSSSPTMVRLPLRLSYPRRGRRDTHQLRHSRVPSVHLPPAHREYSRGCLPRSSPTLSPSRSFSLSLPRSHVPRRRTIGAPKCGDRRRKFAPRNFGSARSVPSAGRRNSPVCAALPCRQVVRSE